MGGAALQRCIELGRTSRALTPEVPRRLKPSIIVQHYAGLKACSTQNDRSCVSSCAALLGRLVVLAVQQQELKSVLPTPRRISKRSADSAAVEEAILRAPESTYRHVARK